MFFVIKIRITAIIVALSGVQGWCAESVVRALCCDAPLFTGSIDHTSYCIMALS